MTGVLSGMTVLLTRPREQGEGLRAALNGVGARTHLIPMLAIEASAGRVELISHARQYPAGSLFIFVSVNAVHFGLPLLLAAGHTLAGLASATVGKTSERALRAAGVVNVVCPASGFDSEALILALADQALDGRPVVIVRGEGDEPGRTLLAQACAARGARVDALVCYRRRFPEQNSAELNQLFADEQIDVVSLMSLETADNFYRALLPQQRNVAQQCLHAVPHMRVAQSLTARYGPVPIAVVGVEHATIIAGIAQTRVTL
jgi:uroporphyrinogen-III synthase